MGKYRLLSLVIKPVLVFDDGNTLEKKEVNPFEISQSQIDSLSEIMKKEIDRLNAETPN